MSAALSLGLIGCGRVAERFYLAALPRLNEARLVAVADPRPERRQLIASRSPGCVAYASAEELIAQARVAAIVIAVPTAMHATIATLALRAGIPVLVEKPLASSPAEAEQLQAASPAADRLVMVAFNRRFWDPIRRLRDILHEQRGPVSARLLMSADRRIWAPISEQSDPLDDLGSHQLDLLRFLFGRELESIRARWIEPHTIRMRMALAGDLTAECVAAHAERSEESITVHCDARMYYIRRGSERIAPPVGRWRSALDAAGTLGRRLRRQPSSLRRSYEHQLRYFLNCVRAKAVPQPTITDGLAVARAMQAARWSAAHDEQEVRLTG